MKLITILGPTATGKTKLATQIALNLKGEIISADSRQVYRGMDIGTGKDLKEYRIENTNIPYHLIDIVDAGYEYNVFEFQRDFRKAYQEITERGNTPILCGGTGMYLEAALSDEDIVEVPQNIELRETLKNKNIKELKNILTSIKNIHNSTDTIDLNRVIRAIEIATHKVDFPELYQKSKPIETTIIGVNVERFLIRRKITERLTHRLKNGMIEEVQALLDKGLKPEQIKFYGLEYKFVTQYILGEINREKLSIFLNTAIHQFAKRQMTWFRRMEKNGAKINWIDGNLNEEEKIKITMDIIAKDAN
ncbi:MAG: tRNA (adenosine(37)-N6)-dimethylallyltransferase MiaA [Bacteroidetes bacterium]|nr:tRNA (adenosine(37)-N6)-dimethylallyltransferase MiaA [Bacteroidota bacterium]